MALRLEGQLSLDGSGWQRGLNQAGTATKGFVSGTLNSLSGQIAAAFSTGAVIALAKKTVEYAGHINDLSDRLGVSTDYLQEMQFVMKQNGAEVDDLTKTFEKMGAARIKALSGADGSAAAIANFQTLGIKKEELKTISAQDMMDKIAASFKQIGNNDVLKTAFKEIGGKGAGLLVPSFISGIEDGRQSARDAGAVIGEDAIMQLDDIGDRFDQLSIRMMSGISPAILGFADAIEYLSNKLGQSQSVLGEVLGNVLAAGEVSSFGDRGLSVNKQLKKYGEQLKSRVAKGELTPEEAKKRYAQADKNTEMSVGLFDGVSQSYSDTVKSQNARAAANETERKARIAERKKVQEGGVYDEAESGLKKVRRKMPSDSLVGVGNFLGSGGNTITNIAQKHLKVANDQLATGREVARLAKASLQVLERVASNSLGIPLH